MSHVCSRCSKKLVHEDELARGICSTCFVATLSPEKQRLIGHIVDLAFRRVSGEPISDDEMDQAIEESLKCPR